MLEVNFFRTNSASLNLPPGVIKSNTAFVSSALPSAYFATAFLHSSWCRCIRLLTSTDVAAYGSSVVVELLEKEFVGDEGVEDSFLRFIPLPHEPGTERSTTTLLPYAATSVEAKESIQRCHEESKEAVSNRDTQRLRPN